MEDKSMKLTTTTILTGSFLLLFPLSYGGEQSVKKDHFLSINPNIKNEKLRAELEILMTNFDAETQKVQDYYTEEIEILREERRSEVKTIKNKFGEKREALMKKYGKENKLMYSKPGQLNVPNKKAGENKKPKRKQK